jgi:glycosyltransferase involved in cell wall biosynthesis
MTGVPSGVADAPPRPRRIWLTQVGEPLPLKPVREMRTSMLARALAARGHQVTWWSSSFDHFTKSWHFPDERVVALADNLDIRLLRGCGYKRNLSPLRYVDHRIVAARFRSVAPSLPRPHLIMASIPSHDLAFQAARFATSRRIPFAIDARDQWPDVLEDALPRTARVLLRPLLSWDHKMSQYALSRATRVFSMADSVLRWAQSKGGRLGSTGDRVFYLGGERSAPPPHPRAPMLRALESQIAERPVIAFVGAFGRSWAPTIVARVAQRMRESNALFVLGGDGEFFDEVKAAGAGAPNVILPGWLDSEDISWLLSRATIGVIPCSIQAAGLPNKFFSYAAFGVPVVSSLGGDAAKLLLEEKIGLRYPVGDDASLETQLRRMLASHEERAAMSHRMQRLFDRELSQAAIYSAFARTLESIASP